MDQFTIPANFSPDKVRTAKPKMDYMRMAGDTLEINPGTEQIDQAFIDSCVFDASEIADNATRQKGKRSAERVTLAIGRGMKFGYANLGTRDKKIVDQFLARGALLKDED